MATGPSSVTVQLVMLLGGSWRRFDRSAVHQILLQSRIEFFFAILFIRPPSLCLRSVVPGPSQ